jgi:hypothetical protein
MLLKDYEAEQTSSRLIIERRLPLVLFLRHNRERWNEQTIQSLLDEKQAAAIELEE